MIFVTLQLFAQTKTQLLMTLKELKEEVQQLIRGANVKKAIAQIIDWAQENQKEQLKREVSLLKSELTDLSREKRLGLLSNSEVSLRQNKLNYSVLTLLDDVIEDISSPDNHDNDSSSGVFKILMLTANPANTTKLNLNAEHSGITQKLQETQNRFKIILRKAVSGTEFKEFTQQEQPAILHFSGHGEEGKYAGIVVQNDDKNEEELISIKGLKSLFKLFKKSFKIKVVLLNACYTQAQAKTISEYVEYVIGTNVAIGDKAAGAFSSGFYFQLANDTDMNVEDAFDSGRTEAVMKGADEENFVIYRHGEQINVE